MTLAFIGCLSMSRPRVLLDACQVGSAGGLMQGTVCVVMRCLSSTCCAGQCLASHVSQLIGTWNQRCRQSAPHCKKENASFFCTAAQDTRKAEKAAKDEEQRQADLRSYKNVMTVWLRCCARLIWCRRVLPCLTSTIASRQKHARSDKVCCCHILPPVLQADSMSSNKDMAQKYKSAADYEDDFMWNDIYCQQTALKTL